MCFLLCLYLYVHYVYVSECLRLGGGDDYRRQRGTDRDDSGGQQDDDEDDDEDDYHDDHDQLDVLPPVGASHFLRRLLEVLSLNRKRRDNPLKPQCVEFPVGRGVILLFCSFTVDTMDWMLNSGRSHCDITHWLVDYLLETLSLALQPQPSWFFWSQKRPYLDEMVELRIAPPLSCLDLSENLRTRCDRLINDKIYRLFFTLNGAKIYKINIRLC